MRLVPPLFLRCQELTSANQRSPFSSREDEMIWQDPVDYSHITYEYDHRCVNYYQVHNIDLGASHSVLYIRSCDESTCNKCLRKIGASECSKDQLESSTVLTAECRCPIVDKFDPCCQF